MNDENAARLSDWAAKELARDVLLRRHPGCEEWVTLAWSYALRDGRLPQFDEFLDLSRGFPIAANELDELREVVSELAILVDGLLGQFPSVKEDLLKRVEAACEHRGRTEIQTKSLLRSLGISLDDPHAFVVWITRGESFSTPGVQIGRGEFHQWLARKNEFNVFICERTVLGGHKKRLKLIHLEERHYWLLVILLRYRLRAIPVKATFLKVWGSVGRRELVESEILEGHLKPAISELRKAMRSVPGFNIPQKDRRADTGYVCTGNFDSCVIVPRSDVLRSHVLPD